MQPAMSLIDLLLCRRLFYRRLFLETNTRVTVPDRFKIPASPPMRYAKARERSVESVAIVPFLGEGILDNPHIILCFACSKLLHLLFHSILRHSIPFHSILLYSIPFKLFHTTFYKDGKTKATITMIVRKITTTYIYIYMCTYSYIYTHLYVCIYMDTHSASGLMV